MHFSFNSKHSVKDFNTTEKIQRNPIIFTRVIEQPHGQDKVINTFALCWRALKNIKITYPNITMLQNKEMHLPKEEEKKKHY